MDDRVADTLLKSNQSIVINSDRVSHSTLYLKCPIAILIIMKTADSSYLVKTIETHPTAWKAFSILDKTTPTKTP